MITFSFCSIFICSHVYVSKFDQNLHNWSLHVSIINIKQFISHLSLCEIPSNSCRINLNSVVATQLQDLTMSVLKYNVIATCVMGLAKIKLEKYVSSVVHFAFDVLYNLEGNITKLTKITRLADYNERVCYVSHIQSIILQREFSNC